MPAPSTCTCHGPPPGPDTVEGFRSKGKLLASGAAIMVGRNLPGVPQPIRDATQGVGEGMIAVATVMYGLDFMSELGGILMEHERLHPWDVRHETAERKARLQDAILHLHADVAALPTDEVELLMLHEETLRLLGANGPPAQDPCGWYRFGWRTHNHVMEAFTSDVGVAQTLALAAADDDGPALMRLAGIPADEVGCRRFWFGFRDANAALAAAAKATDSTRLPP